MPDGLGVVPGRLRAGVVAVDRRRPVLHADAHHYTTHTTHYTTGSASAEARDDIDATD